MPTLPGSDVSGLQAERFFFYNLFESDPTGAPLAVFGRSHGSIDGYAAAVGRWLVTRDGFDFLVYYLPDYDFASHAHGPDEAFEALTRSDAAIGALLDAAGGPDEFLERYAVVLSSITAAHVDRHVRLETPFGDLDDVLVTASNRARMVSPPGDHAPDTRSLAERLDRGESTSRDERGGVSGVLCADGAPAAGLLVADTRRHIAGGGRAAGIVFPAPARRPAGSI